MEYLTNEKLLKQQQSGLFSICNSRSNSVSRFPIPSQRTSNDPVNPTRSADLFNKLDDILKQKQLNTTTRKRQKQISCIINQQIYNEENQNNIELSCYKSPIKLIDVPVIGFLDNNIEVRNKKQNQAVRSLPVNQQYINNKIRNTIQNQFQESQNLKKKESLQRFQQEFSSMQDKIRSKNSILLEEQEKITRDQIKEKKMDLNLSTAKENTSTLNRLNCQLQIQNNHLQEQLIFEQNQNNKLNILLNNLNDQIATLNKQINQQQLASNDIIKQLNSQIEQLQFQTQQKDQEIHDYQEKISEYKKVEKEMQDLEKLCSSMSFYTQQSREHNNQILEIQNLLQVQHNIIEKVTNNKDFPIDQLIIQKRQRKKSTQYQINYQELSLETSSILDNIIKQIKTSVEQLTERFIHDLLI